VHRERAAKKAKVKANIHNQKQGQMEAKKSQTIQRQIKKRKVNESLFLFLKNIKTFIVYLL